MSISSQGLVGILIVLLSLYGFLFSYRVRTYIYTAVNANQNQHIQFKV